VRFTVVLHGVAIRFQMAARENQKAAGPERGVLEVRQTALE
jgi:hypothetical protein